jgi:transketolase
MSDKDATAPSRELEELGINVIRGLAMDAPRAANSGHTGTAMALAPLAHVLWTRIMKYDASEPEWPDRDRFILSAGHASILLYSMLHLTGTDLMIDDLKNFRQWGSKTPGHPEIHHVQGVDVTTGPLGQGFGNGVGFGIAERWMRSRFGPELCDHHTFVVCGDGDLQEGISHEAASLAGHLGLGRLVYIYDDNHISIDGPTELSYSDDVAKRFEAYGWHVDDIGESANDLDKLESSLRNAMAVEDKPSLIILRSHIGYPSPTKVDTAAAHGEPFDDEEIRRTKEIMGLPVDQSFYVPDEVLDMYRNAGARGASKRADWDKAQSASGNKDELQACLKGTGVSGWHAKLPTFEVGKMQATRVSVNECVNAVLDTVPGLIAGGADLTGNTGTKLESMGRQSAETPDGRQVFFGIREHGMAAAMVGMAYHGGTLPIGGTFFTFSDYMRPSVRLAAMGEAHCIFFWTHDSVGLGEDGPTHQPIEQLAAMRAMPGLSVLRPADANETAHAFRIAVDGKGAHGLVLSRQKLPVLEGTADAFEGVSKGAYVLVDCEGEPDVVLVGTGSEVHICVEAAKELQAQGVGTRVVSMPSWDLFEAAGTDYQELVLPSDAPTLSVEAASSFGWDRWADAQLAIDQFGASAPGDEALRRFGFTADTVVEAAQSLLEFS